MTFLKPAWTTLNMDMGHLCSDLKVFLLSCLIHCYSSLKLALAPMGQTESLWTSSHITACGPGPASHTHWPCPAIIISADPDLIFSIDVFLMGR